jgi:hypothetical protein
MVIPLRRRWYFFVRLPAVVTAESDSQPFTLLIQTPNHWYSWVTLPAVFSVKSDSQLLTLLMSQTPGSWYCWVRLPAVYTVESESRLLTLLIQTPSRRHCWGTLSAVSTAVSDSKPFIPLSQNTPVDTAEQSPNEPCSLPCIRCTKNKRMIQIPAHRAFFIKRTQHKSKRGCVMLLKEKKERKFLYLERRSPVHGGEFRSSQVPCLISTDFMPLALPSPSHPLPAKRTFIYTQTTLTCQLLHRAVQLSATDIAESHFPPLTLPSYYFSMRIIPRNHCLNRRVIVDRAIFYTRESLLTQWSHCWIHRVNYKFVWSLNSKSENLPM